MCTGPHDFIPAPNIVCVQVVYVSASERVQNVFNVLSGGGTSVGDMNRIGAKIEDWLRTDWDNGSSSLTVVNVISMTDAGVEAGVGVERVPATALAGSVGQPPLPANVTFAVKWNTGLTGRSNRGRTFHVGITADMVLFNQINPSQRAMYLAMYTALLTKLAAGGTVDKLAVVSYCHDGDWRPTAEINPVISCSIDFNLDSMRRRLTGRGS